MTNRKVYQGFRSDKKVEEHCTTVLRLHHRQTWSYGTEGWNDASVDTKQMVVQCATFSRSLNPRNVEKSISEILIRIRLPFESSFWISVSGCKLTIQCQAKFLTSAKFLTCCCLSVILLLRIKKKSLAITFLMCVA